MAKTILITGASSGIGAGMAREFAKKGYNLAICARRLERLETLKQELESQYDIKVIAKTLDVTNYDQVFEVFRAFKEDFGTIDRIIVNAGVGEGRRIGKGNLRSIKLLLKPTLFLHWHNVKLQWKFSAHKTPVIW
jgi:Short-chain dehydrogenases of various substrate specificities